MDVELNSNDIINPSNEKKNKRGRKPTKELNKTPKKRGRKPKNQENNKPAIEKTPKKRGRKPQSKIYSVNKNSINDVQTNITSNLILHLKINLTTIKSKSNDKKNFIEDSLLNYSPGLTEPIPFDPNTIDSGFNFDNKDNNFDSKFSVFNDASSRNKKKNMESNSNLDIQLSNRRIYTSMQQFIEEWPKSTEISCFWCCHQFDNVPCTIPEEYYNSLFKVKGCFCSFNCATAYLFKNESNTNILWEKYSMLHLLRNKLLNNNETKVIKPAPPREALSTFGGYLSINEFRNNSEKIYTIVSPPVIMLCPQIDENSYNSEIKTSQKKFIPVDQDKIKQAGESLRLKRSKPLPNHRMSLENLLTA